MQSDHRKYQVLEPVGKGGFGTVYRAQLLGAGGFQKIVALKVLNADVHGAVDFAERLRDEARMLGLLQHRSIVRVDGLHQLNGRWTVVMEFVPGIDLKRLLTAGAVPVAPTLELMEEVADALYSAYERPGPEGEPLRLLHRDIKPSNIHLTSSGEVKVLDFGVARADFKQRESVTRSFFFGSLAYMAPERLDGIDTHAGDVYAMGSVMYELLTGTSLGRTSGNPTRHADILAEGMERLSPGVDDPRIEDLLRRTLAYEAEDRPTARELAREIRGLRASFATPWLRDWAEETVPGLKERQEPVQDDLSGSILIERPPDPDDDSQASGAWLVGSIPERVDGETWIQEIVQDQDQDQEAQEVTSVEPPSSMDSEEFSLDSQRVERLQSDSESLSRASAVEPPNVISSPRRMGMLTGLMAGVALVMALVLLGVSAYIVWDMFPGQSTSQTTRKRDRRPRKPASEAAQKKAQEVAPALESEDVEEVSDPDVESNLAPEEETRIDPEVESTPEPRVEVEAPPETVSGDEGGSIRATGAIVQLQADGVTWPMGPVPAGTYTIWATFVPGASPIRAGDVEIGAGEEITLKCWANMKRCAPVSY